MGRTTNDRNDHHANENTTAVIMISGVPKGAGRTEGGEEGNQLQNHIDYTKTFGVCVSF